MNLWIVVLLATMLAQLVHSQIAENTSQHRCTSNERCHECVQVSDCAWCAQPNIGNTARCLSLSEITGSCLEEFIYNPDNELRFTIAKQLGRGDIQEGDVPAYVFPQRVNLKLRKNQVHRLNVTYSQSGEFPVDLYYLFGLSKSSKNDKQKFSSLGAQLSAGISNITSNFRLGFGSFADKVQTGSEGSCEDCGYQNHMTLGVPNATEFSSKVDTVASSGNLDASKDGLDAIMQAIACRQDIGWRDMARRILVFATDEDFHQAGDGNLFVATTPNDGRCHMNTNGKYTDSSTSDHPSISHINLKVKENAVNIIFAVKPNKRNIYDPVSSQIEGSSVASLSEDSSNVVELVREHYSKISASVELKDNSPSAIKVNYYSACSRHGVTVPTKICHGLKSGDVVVFEAEIVITECPSDPKDWFKTFEIYPVGINESLIVDLEMLCGCPCETSSPNCEGQED